MNKTSLLRKAEEKLKNTSAGTGTTTGISPEDRAEIISQIEKLTSQNRRTFDAAAFTVKAQKQGILFPLMVNLIIVGATAFALYSLAQYFSQRTTEIQQTGTALSSAEGKLIQEIKKEAEGRLAQKEQEISQVQERLAQLEKAQASLQASFEERLAQKEAEYNERVQQEIEQERERLIKQGLSEAVIQERLKKFEVERLAFYKQKIDEYQKQLEQERLAAEASYTQLRQEYSRNIASLNAERQNIQEEARQREQQIRSSLEQKNQELAAQTAQVRASLEEAKRELARIDEQRRASAAAEDQIAGLYQAIQGAFQTRRYDEALKTITTLKSLLNDPAISSLPALQKRRNGDLFALDVMGQMARLEVERTSIDTNLLLAQAEALAAIRSAVQEGRRALQNKDQEGAAVAFQRALNRIPEVTEAHQYFINRSLGDRELAVKTALSALSRATAARLNMDYTAASLAYGKALEALGLSTEESLAVTQGISALAVGQNRANLATGDTAEARNLIRRANNELNQRKWSEAIKTFAGLLKKYPYAEQSETALEGIDTALRNMTQEAEQATATTAKQIPELEAKMSQLRGDLEKTIAELNSLKGASAQALQEKDRRITKLEQLLEEERQQSKLFASQAGPGGTGPTSTGPLGPNGTGSDTLEQDLTQLREENQRLTQIASQYDTLSQAYQSYQIEEDRRISQGGSGSLVAARAQLESFLTNPSVQRVFPGLRDRILRYERAYIEAGQKESLYNAITIVDTAFRLKDEASHTRYFQDLRARYRDNEAMLNYIEALQKGLR